MQTAAKLGINRFVCVSATEKDWDKVATVAQEYFRKVIPAFALHPWYLTEATSKWEKRLEKMLIKHPQALIGECGFDSLKNKDIKAQAEVFDIHLQLAKKHKRTLLIHAVKAEMSLEAYWSQLPEKFVIHSFNGNIQMLEKIIKYGGYAGVNATILKKKNANELLRKIPLAHLLFETDAPYQTTFKDMLALCTRIATVRGKNVEDLVQEVYANSLRMLNNEQ